MSEDVSPASRLDVSSGTLPGDGHVAEGPQGEVVSAVLWCRERARERVLQLRREAIAHAAEVRDEGCAATGDPAALMASAARVSSC